MIGWPIKTLGEVCDLVNGATPDTKVKDYWGGSHAWITPAEMGGLDSPFLSISRRTLSDKGLASCSATLVPPKTVIISSRAPIGHLVINEVPMATNQGCKSLIPKDGLDFNFLYYYLKANVELLESLGTGTTFKELSGTQLKSVTIPVPALDEQKKIVALLDTATAHITELTACYEQARTHANNLFTSALRDALESNPDWPVKTLGDLMTVQNGYAFDSQFFSSDGKIGLIRIRDLKSGTDTETRYTGQYDDDYLVSSGDYLIGMDGEFRCYEWQGEPALLNQRVCRLRGFDKTLESRFLFYGINKYLKDIEDVTGYTTVKHLSSKSILAIEMPVPPLEEQKRIVARLDSMRAKTSEMVAAYDAKLTAAKNLRQSILEAAFAGDL